MNKLNFETDLREQLESLNKEKQPDRDLWAGIEIALANEDAPNDMAHEVAANNRPRIYAVAASILLVGVLSWNALKPVSQNFNGTELIAALSSQHQQQKNALLVKFQDQPALTQNWESQLGELDEAAIAIKAALKQDPNNVALLKMLQSVHQQQIDLIERVHAPKWRQL